MSKLRKLQQLSFREWVLLVQAQVLLLLTLVGVYVFGVSRWQNVLARLAKIGNMRAANTGEDHCRRTSGIAQMVNVAGTYGVFRAHCLQRSLVLWCLLERNSIESELRYGARKENGQIQAHAWVEIQGVALIDNVHRDFPPLQDLTGRKVSQPSG